MTDKARMLKPEVSAGTHTHFHTCFSNFSELQGSAYISFSHQSLQTPITVQKNHQDCERALPLQTTSFNNRCQRKEVHKSINPRLLPGTKLKSASLVPNMKGDKKYTFHVMQRLCSLPDCCSCFSDYWVSNLIEREVQPEKDPLCGTYLNLRALQIQSQHCELGAHCSLNI